MLAKNCTEISQTSACELPFHSARLRIKIDIQFDCLSYCATESYRKHRREMLENKHIVPGFTKADEGANFRLTTGHVSTDAHLHTLSNYLSPLCVLCTEGNSIMIHNVYPDFWGLEIPNNYKFNLKN